MKRETGVAVYFWVMIFASLGWAFAGNHVAAAVMAAAAGIVGVINLIARDYFDGP